MIWISYRVENDRLNRKEIIVKKVFAFMLALAMIFSFATEVCGRIISPVDPGDLGDPDGNGKRNLSDVSIMLKYIAKWDLSEHTFIEEAADVTCDGKINLHDASKMLMFLAGWPGLIEPPKDTSPITTETAIAT